MKRFHSGIKHLILLALVFAALVLSGCADSKKEEAKPEAEKAEVKQEEAGQEPLILAFDAVPVAMDPHVQLSGGMLQYSHMVFDPLVRWTQDMDIEPRLAKSWEQIDPLTLRFKLREGVKFHSGNEFTAEDVAYTLERLKKSEDFKGLFEPFDKAVAVDPYTVDIKTKEPYGLTLAMCTYIFPLDKKFYAGKDEIVKSGPSFANENESGTGPFVVTKYVPGEQMAMKANPNYWTERGNVEELVIKAIPNSPARVAALLSKDVDFIMPVPPTDMKRIDETEGLKLTTLPGSRIITLQMNQERRPEFKNQKVRQAIVHAIDNPGIVEKIMKGFATAAGQQGPKGYAGYVEELTPRYDLEKAQQLMKDAGYENGFECTMIAPNNRYVNDAKIAEAVVSMLSKINITVNLKTMPKAQYWDQFDARTADIQMIGWHSDTEDSANFSEYLMMCPDKETGIGQYNSGEYCNAKVDELVIASRSETDMAKRAEMLQEVERILYEDAAFVPLHWQDLAWASKDNMNTEVIVNTMNFPYFGDLVVK
ncbi:ABC transporter substrate-binding protein [Salidesulfovibrio brasiliensis]|uniref:ABC transporter substrate-binding protein n=1 Tax=Salidesulfovibrio brasiliensis TaxID=221711 RepID=UPI000A94AA29|nr:ABC transporter substrate-binding protein [Salidesulfovibrio brasiliensis]